MTLALRPVAAGGSSGAGFVAEVTSQIATINQRLTAIETALAAGGGTVSPPPPPAPTQTYAAADYFAEDYAA